MRQILGHYIFATIGTLVWGRMYWENIPEAFPDGRDFATSGPRDRPTVILISLTSRANYKCNYSSLPITSFVTLWLTSKLLKQIQHSKTTIDYDFVHVFLKKTILPGHIFY